MQKLSEKQKLIQEKSRVMVKKDKESKENMAAVKGSEGGNKREQEYELDQQNRALDAAACDDVKNTLRVVKSGIGFHNFRHNNIQIINFNFKILASYFFFL